MFWSVGSDSKKVCVLMQNLNRIVVSVLFRGSEFSSSPFIFSVGPYPGSDLKESRPSLFPKKLLLI